MILPLHFKISNIVRWSLRNCSLMLFRSIIDRLLGSNESHEADSGASVTSCVSYERHKGLLDIMSDLLRNATSESNFNTDSHSALVHFPGLAAPHEAIFPILDLLRRAPPPNKDRERFRHSLLKAVDSAQWQVRYVASKTYASLFCYSALQEQVALLCFGPESRRNAIQGRLLCIRWILETRYAIAADRTSRAFERPDKTSSQLQVPQNFAKMVMEHLQSTFCKISDESLPCLVKATYLDVMQVLGEGMLRTLSEPSHARPATTEPH